jgi:hypothetical protein
MKASTCTICSAGKYADRISNKCKPCTVGTFSPAPADSCTSCPLGSYSATGEKKCHFCTRGQYFDPIFRKCTNCRPSYYSSSPEIACVKCAPGTYSKSKESSCHVCDEGSRVNATQTVCITIQSFKPTSGPTFSSTFLPTVDATPVDHPPRGERCWCGQYYDPNTKLCKNCGAGTFSVFYDEDCQPCPPGLASISDFNCGCFPCVSGQRPNAAQTGCVVFNVTTHPPTPAPTYPPNPVPTSHPTPVPTYPPNPAPTSHPNPFPTYPATPAITSLPTVDATPDSTSGPYIPVKVPCVPGQYDNKVTGLCENCPGFYSAFPSMPCRVCPPGLRSTQIFNANCK